MRQDLEVTARARLEALYREHGGRLWWAVLAYSHDREVANDAVAEAFALALARDDVRDPLAWIWKVTFRVATRELKLRRRSAHVPLPDREVYSDEEAAAVAGALAALSSRQREAILLHYYGGYSVKEVASMLGLATPTVRVHLHRGRENVRMRLEDERD